ncbi:MAG TPA: DUF6644 family protein [Steroidobacteraceae bacterium]|jgi:hypothetical protein|nr:DUF6644 family protein [Steroidobacteraceae bacterium]
MSPLLRICEWLHELPLSTSIRESENAYSVIETVHVLGITAVLGTISVVDVRLLGGVLTQAPVARIARPLIRLTWCGFIVMFVSGALLFAAQAATLYSNAAFRIKLLLLALLALNVVAFHSTVFKSVEAWGSSPHSPARARFAAFVSLFLWSGVIASGRAIAYLNRH